MPDTCTKLMVIRHAEKPDPLAGIAGISEAGVPDKDELSVKGWRRAGALVRFFNPHPTGNLQAGIAVPGAIFGTAPDVGSPSKRPLHTVTPLACDLGIEIRREFTVHQEGDLVGAARAAAPAVLICWHHERIQKIAGQLGISIDDWPDSVFDRVLVFDRTTAGWEVTIVQQRLLPGDA